MTDYPNRIAGAYTNLVEVNNQLLTRYIKPHEGNVNSSNEDFSLDVKSYLILLHAAIEDYIEGISVFSSDIACAKRQEEGLVTLPFLFLFAKSKSYKERVSDKKINDVLANSPELFILSSLGDIHGLAVANAIDNNGINVRYLNSLLQHFGINFDITDNDFISWKTLADYRGDYAHAFFFNHGKKPTAKKILSPEDALNIGNDCISFANKIKNEALASLQLDPQQ